MEDKYYENIKQYLVDDEIYARVKDYSKEKHKVITYYAIGKILSDAGKSYGENIIGKYADQLMREVDKKYNDRTLRRMRQLYLFFEKQKWSPTGTKLSISHIRVLFSLTDKNKVNYYAKKAIDNNLSKRELENIVKSNEYDRLPTKTRNKLNYEEKFEVKDLVPNPIFIKNKTNNDIATEKALHDLILEDIESFMKELGNNFSFIGSEYKIKIGNTYHKIDLLLFNIKYNAYVVIELKITPFKAEYISQVKKYMNYIDKNVKEISNNNTIGIIICKKENRFIIEYCSDERIIVREYELV